MVRVTSGLVASSDEIVKPTCQGTPEKNRGGDLVYRCPVVADPPFADERRVRRYSWYHPDSRTPYPGYGPLVSPLKEIPLAY